MRRPIVLTVLAAALVIAAGGCPTLDLGEMPVSPGACQPDPAYFETVIWPEYIAPSDAARSCIAESGCHDANNNPQSGFRVSTTTPINFRTNYDAATRFLNCSTPEASPLLTKPLSTVDAHGGGELFDSNSAPEQTFLTWFNTP